MSRGGVVACCRLSPSLATSIAVALAVALAIPVAGDAFAGASKALGVDIQRNLGPDGLQTATNVYWIFNCAAPYDDIFRIFLRK